MTSQKNGPPPERVCPPAGNQGANYSADTAIISARAVSWLPVHEHVSPILAAVGSWPMVGTPAWCALPAGDPAKEAAVYDAAQHWALHIEGNQTAMTEASKAIAGAADWPQIAREVQQRRGSSRIARVVTS